jgi:hypothetical protein
MHLLERVQPPVVFDAVYLMKRNKEENSRPNLTAVILDSFSGSAHDPSTFI